MGVPFELAEEADRLSGMTAGIDRENFLADSSCRDCWGVIAGWYTQAPIWVFC